MKTDTKKISLRTIIITLVIALAAFTLAYSSYNATTAVINAQTGADTSTLKFQSTGISLSMGKIDTNNYVVEEGAEETGNSDYDDGFVPGRTYSCPISATNGSSYDAYMRIIVTKYWTDENGKVTTVDPAAIELSYTTEDSTEDYNSGSWKLDEDSVTAEQAIYYYGSIVPAGGDTSVLINGMSIDPELADDYTETTSNGVTTTTWKYGELTLHIEAEAQLVQAAGGANAQLSAWGVAKAG